MTNALPVDDSGVTAFFPKPSVPEPSPAVKELSSKERLERASSIIKKATMQLDDPVAQETSETLPGAGYVSFTNVEGLSSIAKVVYEAAATASGISLEELLRAVRMLEQKMVVWGKEQKRAEREQSRGLSRDGSVVM